MIRSLRYSSPALVAVCLVLPVLAGCGGAGGTTHTYVIVAPAKDASSKGIYVTYVSPLAIPANVLTKRGGRLVAHATGPQVCSFTKTVHGSNGPLLFLRGKTVTVKVNGSNPRARLICSALKRSQFNTSGK